jgi:ATP-dependent RNA helicase DeaD
MMAMPTEETASGFKDLGLDSRLLSTLESLEYNTPSPIQKEAIPLVLQGRDLIGLAGTGTGKTAAFALPMLQRLAQGAKNRSALILVPTRELAIQVTQAVEKYGKSLNLSAVAVFGGQPYGPQISAMKRGVSVIVATPGRALDHLRKGTFPLQRIDIVILDEADEMLDMGFAEDIESILAGVPENRQTLLFSATMPPRIASLADKYLRDPIRVEVAREVQTEGKRPRVRQMAYIVNRKDKIAALSRILDLEEPTSAIIFCQTRGEVEDLSETLAGRGFHPEAIHGGMSQEQRDRVMKKFRSENTNLLIATDVAARGLDITHLSHVVNFHVPRSNESYVHRIGRVGRAGREGMAITLAEPREQRQFRDIERLTKQKIEIGKIPTTIEVRAKREERLRAELIEKLQETASETAQRILAPLFEQFDPKDVAAAILSINPLLAEESEPEPDIEDPLANNRGQRPNSQPRDRTDSRSYRDREPRGNDRPAISRPGQPSVAGGRARFSSAAMGKIYIGAGAGIGVSARDLVGAIANECGLTKADIGMIDIAERFSIVEVLEELIEDVIVSLQGCRIKGRKVIVRRDRQHA